MSTVFINFVYFGGMFQKIVWNGMDWSKITKCSVLQFCTIKSKACFLLDLKLKKFCCYWNLWFITKELKFATNRKTSLGPWKTFSRYFIVILGKVPSQMFDMVPTEAGIQGCSYKKMFWKYAYLQENTHAELWFQ